MASKSEQKPVKIECQFGTRLLTIETGKIARQAHGAAVVSFGETVVLGTVVTGPPREGIDFFPLQVDYREKMSAAGKFPGGFFKREGRPSSKEILSSRMIDRPIRPLFPKPFKDEVQIQVMVLASDLECDPDVVSIVAAGAALAVSPLPMKKLPAGVRVGRVDGKFLINPTRAQLEYSDIDLVVAGHIDAVNMIEVGAREVPEEVVYEAIKFGHEFGIVPICKMLDALRKSAGKEVTWTPPEPDTKLEDEIRGRIWDKMVKAKSTGSKQDRIAAIKAVYETTVAEYCPPDVEKPEYEPGAVKAAIRAVEQAVVRERILTKGDRSDGRGLKDLRQITCEVDVLPRVHGSSLFTRGETQSLVTTTLGTASDEQVIDDMMEEYSKKFLLHYNFPPFSVGECRRIMGPGRREIGHGALAERSLEAILPSPEQFPYTIRLVSDILESNGSSSMASVCGGSLALMAAGVPVKAAVAGISVGLVQDGDKYALFPDILGEEDGFGDMDFKVAGSRTGVTGVQLDLKAEGLPFPILKEAIAIARDARMKILDIMDATIAESRPEISRYAPRLITIKINPEKIGKLIGPGGRTIREIQANTGAQIDIEDDGTVYIAHADAEKALAAQQAVERLTEDVRIGQIYEGRVIGIKDFGAFVEIIEGQDGLCHISELDDAYVRSVNDVVKLGDVVRVKVISIDDQGRVKLSRKAAMKEEQGVEAETA